MFQPMPYTINITVAPSTMLGIDAKTVILIIAALTFVVAAVQLIAIYQGLAQMKQASKERDAQLARQAEHLENQNRENQRRHKEAMTDGQRRHEQAMAALTALLERIDRRSPQPSTA